MIRYVISPRAQNDIAEIWDDTSECWGIDRAERDLRQIQTSVDAVAAEPRLGASCEDIRAGYRKSPAGSHLLFHRMIEDGSDVVRALHGRMDVGRLL